MANPIDLLSEQEINDIKKFVSETNGGVPVISSFLDSWNKNKRTLLKCLGGQLRVKIPMELSASKWEFQNALEHEYYPITYYKYDYLHYNYPEAMRYFNRNQDTEINRILEELYRAFCDFLIEEEEAGKITNEEARNDFSYFTRLFTYDAVMTNEISAPYTFKSIHFSLGETSKTLKSINKVLTLIKYKNMEKFYKFRDWLSNYYTQQSPSSYIVFSIHPLDFLTMSDNNCNWSSCMSWTRSGMYSNGVLTMLNSNNAIVVYLESKTPYIYKDIQIPNKRWRVLGFLHKQFCVLGKQYPFDNNNIIISALNILKDMLAKNIGWKYQYGPQKYGDLLNFWDKDVLDDFIPKKDGHNIVLKMFGMYHDMFEDHEPDYYCLRNYIDHDLSVTLTGPTYCVHCGARMDSYYDYGEHKVCYKCRTEHQCDCCRRYKWDEEFYQIKNLAGFEKVCGSCLSEHFAYIPQINRWVRFDSDMSESMLTRVKNTLNWFDVHEPCLLLMTSSAKVFVLDKMGIQDKLNVRPIQVDDLTKYTNIKMKKLIKRSGQ